MASLQKKATIFVLSLDNLLTFLYDPTRINSVPLKLVGILTAAGISITTTLPTLCSEMCILRAYADKPDKFDIFAHTFMSYKRIGKWDSERYQKGGRKSYFIELCGTPRWINLYCMVDEEVYCVYKI